MTSSSTQQIIGCQANGNKSFAVTFVKLPFSSLSVPLNALMSDMEFSVFGFEELSLGFETDVVQAEALNNNNIQIINVINFFI